MEKKHYKNISTMPLYAWTCISLLWIRVPCVLTDTVPCTNASVSGGCNSTDVPIGEDFLFFPLRSPEPGDISIITQDNVTMYLEQPNVREYIDRFSDTFLKFLVEETIRYCPYIELCNFTLGFTPSPWVEKKQPCCLPCSCQPDCVPVGNCCPDYEGLQLDPEFRRNDNDVEETCMETYIHHDPENIAYPKSRIRAYQTCPKHADETIRVRCESAYQLYSDITFDDIVPLSNNVTMETYRNKHCAVCNGADLNTLSVWTAELSCLVSPIFTSTDALLLAILDGTMSCSIFVFPPNSVDVDTCSNAISRCNVTGLWTDYDPVVDRACAVYRKRIAVIQNGVYVFYKNPLCVICNGIEPTDFLCKFPDSGEQPSRPFSFSGLLRLDSSKKRQISAENICGPGLMFDKIKKHCRKVTCPYHRTFNNGQCDVFLETASAVGYRITSLIRLSTSIPMKDLYEIMPQIRFKIVQLGVINIESICTSQMMLISHNTSVSDADDILIDSIDYRVDVVPRAEHNIDQFVDQLLGVDGVDISVERPTGETVSFKLYLKDDISEYNDQIPYELFENWTFVGTPVDVQELLDLAFDDNGRRIIPYFMWNEKPGSCYFPGSVRRLLTLRSCPMFSVNVTEVGLMMTPYGLRYKTLGGVVVDPSHYVIDDNDQFAIRMCVETYTSIFQPVTKPSEVVGFSAELIVSIISVVVSIVCLAVSLFTYCSLPQLQTLPGKNNMALITSLLAAQCMYLVGSYGGIDSKSLACKLIGGMTHFLWLQAIFWMNVCTFHMFRVLLKTRNISRNSSNKKHALYHAYTISVSVLFVTINIAVSMVSSGSSDTGYGYERCYISTQRMVEFTFGIPAAIVVVSNLSMFTAIIVKLKRAPNVSKNVKHERNYFIVFAKLSTITGATWLFGFLYMWTGISAFSFLFITLNGCQGLFVMLSFICNKRTFTMVKERTQTLLASTEGQTSKPVTMSSTRTTQ